INDNATAGALNYGVADGIGTTRGDAGTLSAGLSGAFFPPKISGIFISVYSAGTENSLLGIGSRLTETKVIMTCPLTVSISIFTGTPGRSLKSGTFVPEFAKADGWAVFISFIIAAPSG